MNMNVYQTRQFFNADAASQRQNLSREWEDACKTHRLSFGKHVKFDVQQKGNYQEITVSISDELKARMAKAEQNYA